MKISSVHVTNFKSLADTGDLALGQVNVLVGRNNHGKSAFIKALQYLQQGTGYYPADVRIGEERATVHVSFVADDSEGIRRYFNFTSNTNNSALNLSML